MEIPYSHLILPFVGGYIFVRFFNYTRINTLRADKDRTVIRASVAGTGAVIAVYVFQLIGTYFWPCQPEGICIPTIWSKLAPFENLGIPFAAGVFAATIWWPLNWIWFDREREINRAVEQDADPLELLLKQSKDESLAVSFTLTSGKVYIGFVTQPFNPVTPTTNVELFPLQSGFRDPVTKEMTLTINYSRTIKKIRDELDVVAARIEAIERGAEETAFGELERLHRDYDRLERTIELFVLVLPVKEISSANIFDSDVHKRYFLPTPKS